MDRNGPASESQDALRVENLRKRLGKRDVLTGVAFSVRQGECLALLGPSGCGKTTLLRLIAGFDDADGGSITINGYRASDPRVLLAPSRRHIAMVFQDLALWPHMTALQTVEFMLPGEIRGRSSRNALAAEVLDSVNLSDHQHRRPHQLSRGEQQRVALARALAAGREILLLDEPFSSADSELRDQMIELVRKVHLQRKLTVLYVTHTIDEVPRLAQRVATMHGGRIDSIQPIDQFSSQRGLVAK